MTRIEELLTDEARRSGLLRTVAEAPPFGVLVARARRRRLARRVAATGAGAGALACLALLAPWTTSGDAVSTEVSAASPVASSPVALSEAEQIVRDAVRGARRFRGATVTSAAFVVTSAARYERDYAKEPGILTSSGTRPGEKLLVVELSGTFPQAMHRMKYAPGNRTLPPANTLVSVVNLRTGQGLANSWSTAGTGRTDRDLRTLGAPTAVPLP